MLAYLAVGALALGLLAILGRWFSNASPSDLAHAVRTFIAVFGMLASTGLLLMGRFGFAIVTIAAAAVAIRSLVKIGRNAEAIDDGGRDSRSTVSTDLLSMELDRETGDLDGTVRSGSFAGKRLRDLGMQQLLGLLDEARTQDPASARLLEAYLERRDPRWREAKQSSDGGADAGKTGGDGPLDERTALAILGLRAGANAEEVRAAHRRLMTKLHPDHGGSDFLASQINRAKDFLLRRRQ